VRLVGRESLSEDDKVTLEVAKLIKDDFLQQNAFTDYDKFCPFQKSVGMMKCMTKFFDLAQKSLKEAPADDKLSWNMIESQLKDTIYKLA